jgi:hypothetical protein
MNYPMPATDVRNNDSTNGASIAGLLRKTKKKVYISPVCVITPWVTQVQ